MRFRRHSIEQLEEMAPHRKDEKRLIAISKEGRQQLEELWGRERADRESLHAGRGWHAPDDGAASG
jgi:glutathione-regulated potassium-efflux system ancillary protein KefC